MAARSGCGFDRRDHAHAINLDFNELIQRQMPEQALAVVVRGAARGGGVENLYDTLIASTLFCIDHDPRSFRQYPSISVDICFAQAHKYRSAVCKAHNSRSVLGRF